MKVQIRIIALAALITVWPAILPAQPTAHYVPGVEGIKAATLPPPGIYLRDYNVFYYADRRNNQNGDEIASIDPEVFIYANVPRIIWITDQQILGGFVGVDALIPIQFTSIKMKSPAFDDSGLGIGDLFVEGTLSWHAEQFDAAIGYGVWMPTGDSAADLTTRAGLGYWTHMFTAGATWYADPEKKWAISALNRYEINHEKKYTDIKPGQAYTLEWGISHALKPTLEVGLVGYYQRQITEDKGTGANPYKDQVVAIGPELNMFCQKLGMFTSVRYNYEIASEDRFQGHTITITLTKRL